MPLDYQIAEHMLANGLRVIVSEDHSVPNVTVNLWVNVGSITRSRAAPVLPTSSSI